MRNVQFNLQASHQLRLVMQRMLEVFWFSQPFKRKKAGMGKCQDGQPENGSSGKLNSWIG
jgi:hypothetical protein